MTAAQPARRAAAGTRRRDATRSRELLLRAATELFAEHGFDRTTVREIADRAGVDAALIARYFGSKGGLYIASLRAENGDRVPPDLLHPGRMRELLDRLSRRGTGPVLQSAVRAHDDVSVREAARAELQSRMVGPLRARFTELGLDRPQLRAEVAIAAFAGIALGRDAGAFDELAGASLEDLLSLTTRLLSGLAEPG
jgi:AcrR family transcriptional regulator